MSSSSRKNKRVLLAGLMGFLQGYQKFKIDQRAREEAAEAERVKAEYLAALQERSAQAQFGRDKELAGIEHGYRMEEKDVDFGHDVKLEGVRTDNDIRKTQVAGQIESGHIAQRGTIESSLVGQRAAEERTTSEQQGRIQQDVASRNEYLLRTRPPGVGATPKVPDKVVITSMDGTQQRYINEGDPIPAGWYVGNTPPVAPRQRGATRNQYEGFGPPQLINPGQ